MLAVLGFLPIASAGLRQHVAEVSGPWVGGNELSRVKTIDCLKQKQESLSSDCENRPATEAGTIPKQHAAKGWYIGAYPQYNASQCGQTRNATADVDGSHNTAEDAQPFCDPDAILREDERREVEKALFDLWVNTKVPCGIPGTQTDHERNFRLGVALAKTLPEPEQDEQSLALFGDFILHEWNMTGTGYIGRHEGSVNMCADTALLVFVELPERSMVLASPNCDYLCMQRGGQRVQRAAEIGWETSFLDGILTAIEAVPSAIAARPIVRLADREHIPAHLRDLELNSDASWSDTQITAFVIILVLWFGFTIWILWWCVSSSVNKAIWDFRKVFLPGYLDIGLRRGEREPQLL